MRSVRRALRYFGHVARTGSVRAASQSLRIAPSAVSRAVQQLEHELGVPLFDRTVRGLHLTAAGELVLAAAGRWERESDNLGETLRRLSGLPSATVRVASVEVASHLVVPRAAAGLRPRIPGLQLELEVGDTAAVTEAVLNGSAEIGVVINLPRGAPLTTLWTVRNPVGAVLLPVHPLARRKALHLADCADDPLVLPAEGLAARAAVRTALRSIGSLRTGATSNRIVALKALVRAGLGIGVLTQLDVGPELEAGELAFVPLLDKQVEHPFLSVVIGRGAKLAPAVDLFVQALQRELPAQGFRS